MNDGDDGGQTAGDESNKSIGGSMPPTLPIEPSHSRAGAPQSPTTPPIDATRHVPPRQQHGSTYASDLPSLEAHDSELSSEDYDRLLNESGHTSGDMPSGMDELEQLLATFDDEELARLTDDPRSFEDDVLDQIDVEAKQKEVEAEELTYGKLFWERLRHLFWTTIWFLLFAAVAMGLDVLAQEISHWGVSENTQRPLEWGAHLLMYADLVLLAIQLLETAGVHAAKAYRKVLKEATQ